MIILDTNVISELISISPNQSVSRWFRFLPAQDACTTTVTEAEMQYGASKLDAGRRKVNFEGLLQEIFAVRFANRVFSFDRAAAAVFGDICVRRERSGLKIDYPDLQIAAIALSRGASVATRNTTDFEHCGVDIINPWNPPP